MGLNVIPAAPASPESTAEKRQKLLGALEKCDEDLKALKKIIDAVRSSENLRSSPAVKGLDGEDKVRTTYGREEWSSGESELSKKGKSCSEFNSEQPSPVSVLHEFTRPLPSPCPKKHLYGSSLFFPVIPFSFSLLRSYKNQMVRTNYIKHFSNSSF